MKLNKIDTAREPFNRLARSLTHISEAALWLNPLREIPDLQGLSPMDVVFLDAGLRVIDYAENDYVDGVPQPATAISAIVLASGTVTSVQIHKGDQLRICDPRTGVPWTASVGVAGTKRNGPQKGVEHASAGEFECTWDCVPSNTDASSAQVQGAVSRLEAKEAEDIADREVPMGLRFLRWLFFGSKRPDRRHGKREAISGLVAFHWTGGAPKAYRVSDISSTGLFLLTEERWTPGTVIVMTLQLDGDQTGMNEALQVCVDARVTRLGADGVGFEFLDLESSRLNTSETPMLGKRTEKEALESFLKRLRANSS